MKNTNVIEAVSRVDEHPPIEEVRDGSKVPLNKGFRHGDVYFARVEKISGTPINRRQLVQGTSQGSRHIVEGDAVLLEGGDRDTPSWVDPNALLCESVRVGAEGARLTHPTHAHVLLPPNSNWAVWQQLDPNTTNRVVD